MQRRSSWLVDGGIGHRRTTPARLFALKQGDTFVVADAFGGITGEGDGLFRNNTRLLSRFRFRRFKNRA
jgi:glycogen debranching enzyme-like protein